MNICKVAIYDESNVPQICAEKLATFLRTTFGIKVEIYSQLSYTLDDILQCTIKNMLRPIEHQIDQGTHTDSVLMYDGISLQQAFTKMIPQEHQRSDWLHVIFTAKLVGTYDYDGCKYHSRALIGANPAIISTTGIIEAPARPRSYYISQATKVPYDGWNDWIEYKDTRLRLFFPYVCKSYLNGYLSTCFVLWHGVWHTRIQILSVILPVPAASVHYIKYIWDLYKMSSQWHNILEPA